MAMLSHVSIGTNDLDAASAFYDACLEPLGYKRVMSLEGQAVAYGSGFPEFWVSRPIDTQDATPSNGVHVCFNAPSREAVDAFHAAALAAGGKDDGAPGLRDYAPGYYAAFVIDLDGHKVEALAFG